MALSIDGTATASPSASVTLSTTNSNDIIIIYAANGNAAATYTGISDTAGLSWNVAQGLYKGSSLSSCAIWWAYSPAKLTSDVITITGTSATTARMCAFGINGANTTTPIDTNGSIPAVNSVLSGSSLAVTISTNNANDMLLGFFRSNTGITTPSRPSGFSSVGSFGGSTDISSNIVSSIQSSVIETFTNTGTTDLNLIFLAIQAATTGNFMRPSQLSGVGGGGFPYNNPIG